MDFIYLLRALLHRKWIIIGCSVLAVVTAFFLTGGAKKVYRSTAQLSTGFTDAEAMKINDDKFNISQIDVKFNNVIENINSPKVRTLVSYALMLHDLKNPDSAFTRLSPKQKEAPDFKAVDPAKARVILEGKLDSIKMLSPTDIMERRIIKYIEIFGYDVGNIALSLQTARFQRTDYINVVYTSGNPYLSAFAANSVCDQFKRFYGLDRGERTATSIVLLDSLLKQKKAVMDEKINAKNLFLGNHAIVDVNMQSSDNLTQVSQNEALLIEEKGLQQNYSYQVQQYDELIRQERAKGAGNGTAANGNKNNTEYIRLRSEYNDFRTRYLQGGSKDPTIKSQMDDIQTRMSKLQLVGNTTEDPASNDQALADLVQKKITAEAQVRASNQKIASYQTAIQVLKGSLTGMALKGADIKQLDKEIEIATAEFTDAKDRYNLATGLNDNAQGAFVQTLLAEPPLRPEPSKRLVLMLLAGFAAFFISSAVVIVKALMDKSIRTPSNFTRLTGLPLIGIINNVKFTDVNILEQVSFFDEHDNERGNIFKEFLRKLRFELENSGKRIFLFTSTQANQGKTSLIQALAYSLSLGKKRVLIIDTNFCNNDLTMAIHATPVLEKYELDGKPFDRMDVNALVTRTSAPGVNIIGCAGGDYTPSEILPKNHLLNYLSYLREDYDFIFLEGAPLNGFTDTKELESYADSLIAVFSAEQSLTASDRESIAFLRNNGKFLGAVLNKVQDENISQ